MRFETTDIDLLAQRCAGDHVHRAIDLIESQIATATESRRWDEVQKWHQVKLRVHRMQATAEASRNYAKHAYFS